MFLALSLTLNSCNNDDDNNNNSNSLKIDNETFELTQGFAEDYGSSFAPDGFFNVDLTFATKGLNFDQETGSGQIVYFELFSETEELIQTGTYTLDEDFDDGFITSIVNDEVDSDADFVSATVTITKGEKEYYELTFTGIDELDRVITGSYSGAVSYSSSFQSSTMQQ